MSRLTVRDLELRVHALEASQAQILGSLKEIKRCLDVQGGDLSTLKGYVQNVRGGWKVLAVLGGVVLAIIGLIGAVSRFVAALR